VCHVLLKPISHIEHHLISTVAGIVRVHASLSDFYKKTKTYKKLSYNDWEEQNFKGNIFLIG